MTTLSPLVWQQLHSTSQHIPKVPVGVLVTGVLPGSPAHIGGIMEQDVIIGVNGKQVSNSQELFKQIGLELDPITLKLKRNCPLEQDWDGRVNRYETIEMDVKVCPTELNTFLGNGAVGL